LELILAIHDHTARARPSFPADGTLADASDPLPGPANAPPFFKQTDIALTMMALSCLRYDFERQLDEPVEQWIERLLALPLEGVTTALAVAIRFLEAASVGHQHVPTANV
jgi:hypothetical protein